MKLHYLNCAAMFPRCAKWGAPHLSRVPTHCILLEKEKELVLIDTGLGTRDMADLSRLGPTNLLLNARPDLADTAIDQIEKRGLDPADVRHIICTHLHSDHAGGLVDFPQARVHVLRQEFEAMTHPSGMIERGVYRKKQVEHGPRWVLHDESEISNETWFGMPCIRNIPDLPPEIVLVPLIGHTRGHCGVAIDTGEKWVLHCGDAYYVNAELGKGAPIDVACFTAMVHHDRFQALGQVKRIKRVLEENQGLVRPVCTHDHSQYQELFGRVLA